MIITTYCYYYHHYHNCFYVFCYHSAPCYVPTKLSAAVFALFGGPLVKSLSPPADVTEGGQGRFTELSLNVH